MSFVKKKEFDFLGTRGSGDRPDRPPLVFIANTSQSIVHVFLPPHLLLLLLSAK